MPLECRRCLACGAEFEVLVRAGVETRMTDDGCADEPPEEGKAPTGRRLHPEWTRLVRVRPLRKAVSNEAGFAHYNRALGMHIADRAQYKAELQKRGLVQIELDHNEDTDAAMPSTQREHQARSDDAWNEYNEYNKRCDEDPEFRRAIAETERHHHG